MEIVRERGAPLRCRVELLAVPLRAGKDPGREVAEIDAATDGRLMREARQRSADPAKRGAVSVYQTHGKLAPELIAVIGVGAGSGAGELASDDWRRFAGLASSTARSVRARSLAVSIGSAGEGDACVRAAAAAIEGALLGAYRFRGKRACKGEVKLERCVVAGAPASRLVAEAERRARVVADATCFARDLINEPAAEVTPAHLGAVALRVAREGRLAARVLGPRELGRLGMGAIVGVGRGSRNEPRLIELLYRPRAGDARGREQRRRGPVVLVGKGITFDSGGLSLKPPQAMEIQKRDMSGGAAVLGAMRAIAQLRPAIEVRGYVAAAENMPGGGAYRPGDVLRTVTGKTVEVLNTDAEGRLVLADALGWATAPRRGAGPRWVVDVATLTGAVTAALGRSLAAVMGSDADLVRALIECGRECGEVMWELPLVEDYAQGMESTVADLKNVGDGTAATIFGGLFLREFVHGVPWAHIDIAGVAYADKPLPYVPKGAVGWGVRTLVALVERAAAS